MSSALQQKKKGLKNGKDVKTIKKVTIVRLFQVQNHYYKLLLEILNLTYKQDDRCDNNTSKTEIIFLVKKSKLRCFSCLLLEKNIKAYFYNRNK